MRERVYCPVHQKEVVVHHDINPETGRSIGVRSCSHFGEGEALCSEDCIKKLNAERDRDGGGDLRSRKPTF